MRNLKDLHIEFSAKPEIIDHVSLELFGQGYEEPVRVQNPKLPPCWK